MIPLSFVLAAALNTAQTSAITSIVKEAMAKQHLTGVEIGVGRKGTLLYSAGFGLRNRSAKLPVTADTVFAIGSITKQFTAAGAMLLVERGVVSLDAPLSRYLPTIPHAREITVRQLLDQTTGLHDYLEDKQLYASLVDASIKPHPISYYVDIGAKQPLEFKPGTKWAYSNTNYAILGMLDAKMSGKPYETYIRSAILAPQHLNDTEFMAFAPPAGTNVSEGYDYTKNRYVTLKRYDMSWANAAGALASNVQNLIAWDGAFFSGNVLNAGAVATAITPPPGIQMLSAKKDVRNNIALGYAFGWVAGTDEGRRIIWHNGGTLVARAMNLVFPSDGLEIIVLTNQTTANPESIALRIARTLYAP
jgi:D-alanyl-D-alanine carboxypeptidase